MKNRKISRPSELRGLSPSDLQKKKLELLCEQLDLRMQHRSRRLEKTHKLHDLRRRIAQLNTFLTEKTR